MQLGPHFTKKKWNKILGLYDIKPGSNQETEFRQTIKNIFLMSFYEYLEKTKNVKVIPVRGDIMILHPTREGVNTGG